LRHCTASRKVAVGIADDITGNFHLRKPSGRNISLISFQPERNEYQEYFLGG